MRDPDGHPHLARVIDLAMAPLMRLRPGVVGEARGRVLEIAVVGLLAATGALETAPARADRRGRRCRW